MLLMLSLSSIVEAIEKIYYPRQGPSSYTHNDYPIRLLTLALNKSGAQYELLPSPDSVPAMVQGRGFKELENDRGIVHVMWSVTSKEREESVLPIRIPIDKGLTGWRLALVMKQNAGQFKHVKDIKDLKNYSAGQGHDWPDTQILQSNGLRVETSANFESLFSMLEAGRFNYFPRSLRQIWLEAEQFSDKGLVIDQYIVLHYPSGYYYFVNKNNLKLADAIRRGLESAIADGSFDKLFYLHHGQALSLANIKKRTVIELKNPHLPNETPLDRKEFWLDPK